MAAITLAAPDYVFSKPAYATVAFSGGAWQATLPVSNLLDPAFSKVARSTDLATASTQLWCDLGVPRGVQVVAVPLCNGSTACQVRVRGCTTASTATAVCDSGWRALYPVIYPVGSLYWGHPSLWDGLLSAEDASYMPMPFVQVFTSVQVARYWLVEFSDATNPAGYLQLPRVLLAPAWQPSINAAYGASLAVEDNSPVQTSQGAADYFDLRTKRRAVRFSLAFLPEDEALALANDLALRLGVSGQMFFVWDSDSLQHMHRRSFLTRMRSLSPLEAATYGRMTAPFDLLEIVA